jgi:excisionase family DNA binding protein
MNVNNQSVDVSGMKDVVCYRGLAEYLGVSAGTLRHWVMRGRIPYTKAGSRVIFRKKDIEPWLKKNTKKTETAGNTAAALPFDGEEVKA